MQTPSGWSCRLQLKHIPSLRFPLIWVDLEMTGAALCTVLTIHVHMFTEARKHLLPYIQQILSCEFDCRCMHVSVIVICEHACAQS